MSIDEPALGELLVESQDLQSDAMRSSRASLSAMVELGEERRARGGDDPDEREQFAAERRRLMRMSILGSGALASGVLAASGLGVALLGMMSRPAIADEALDVQMLQTSASLENLAVALRQGSRPRLHRRRRGQRHGQGIRHQDQGAARRARHRLQRRRQPAQGHTPDRRQLDAAEDG